MFFYNTNDLARYIGAISKRCRTKVMPPENLETSSKALAKANASLLSQQQYVSWGFPTGFSTESGRPVFGNTPDKSC